ncbi:hypothetical protein LQ938_14920 [Microbacterium sp. cx-55]|uniref:hypothetical protein n=1 Tax=unclassified Microbacterium TaxID=2609290 RepID=UPI001CC06858|nr:MULTISPECIES: hypothetical protein [unclassified Microbacterium]MBZ4488487.1 hypothetical protein [Microbacterium sp. cx-55]MCC4909444.1 hypothetical protein [Microbacterium sp. cx-59]UGB35128.1 hypothetical protein LQ938_14920 [Microbacterium sp. cx-55]
MTGQNPYPVARRQSGDAFPGWTWGLLLVPAAIGLTALGVFFLTSLGTGMGILIGVALIGWAASLAMPFFVIAWYAAQAAWKVPRERQGRTFTAPSDNLRRIAFQMRWSIGARGFMFSPAGYGGPDLPMLVAGYVVHFIGIGVLILAGVIAALVGLASR